MKKSILTNKIFLIVALMVALLIAITNLALPIKALADSEDTSLKTITIFSWEDYIDEGYRYDGDDFPSEYLQATYPREKLEKSIVKLFQEQNPNIIVNYETFATNEEMYNELIRDPNAVDLICPSEYMIMKMRDEGLIRPYTMPENYVKYGSPYIKEVFETLKLNEVTDTKYADVQNPTYAIGYMWGTMGLIYNAQVLGADGNAKYNDEDFTNWSNLLDNKFKNKITIKDSLRDSYILAVAIVHEQKLLEYKEKFESGTMSEQEYKDAIFSTFNDVEPETIEKVEQTLMALKSNLYGFEVDAGKNDLLTGKIDVNFAWSGDAVFSMWEADEFNTELRYVVPEEGSNVWFDGFVMTKNADVESSLKFLDFICNPEIAVRNIDYVGYTSCISGDSSNTKIFDYVLDSFDAEYLPEATLTIEEYEALKDEEKEDYVPFGGGYTLSDDGYGRIVYVWQTPYIDYFTLNEDGTENITERAEIYEVDLKYFFDPSNTTGDYIVRTAETNRHLYAQYADEETIRRCAVMDNFSNESLLLVNEMWSKVKLITLSDLAIILIVVGIALAIGGVVVYKYRDKIFGVRISNKERKIKKGLKVVKKENII